MKIKAQRVTKEEVELHLTLPLYRFVREDKRPGVASYSRVIEHIIPGTFQCVTLVHYTLTDYWTMTVDNFLPEERPESFYLEGRLGPGEWEMARSKFEAYLQRQDLTR
jgi:hypothetical protein